MSDKLDDLEWLEAHWHFYYKSEKVGSVFNTAMGIGGKSAREIIKEMRDYQEKGVGE